MTTKILHILIGDMNNGGIESSLMQIYRNIDKEKFTFDFLVHDEEKNYYEDEIINLGGVVYRVPYISRHFIKHIKSFYCFLKNHAEYKIVHIHTTYAITVFDAMIAKMLKRKVILHSHNSSNHSKNRRIFHRCLRHLQNCQADYRVACSTLASNWMYPSKYREGVFLWKNPINMEKYKFSQSDRCKIRNELCRNDTFVIINIGRLSTQKNQKFLINIFENVCKIEEDSELWLVGDGENRIELERMCKEKKIAEKVVFLGTVDNVNELLCAADVFVFPSLYEGLPLSLIEAQCSGIAIVATDNITKEVMFSNDIILESLDCDESKWCKDIYSFKTYVRCNNYNLLYKNGFEITNEIKRMEEIYFSLL